MAFRVPAAGIAVESLRIDPLTGKTYTFFSDPDGLPLELYQARIDAGLAGGAAQER